ncbi:pyridoxamine 5'-phosphate oxidase-domain-containing protein [Tirmania nivea]|nr:pyridoxamine 5'-phosphate oxidase-domain-containing protein [Tirmania nivea]
MSAATSSISGFEHRSPGLLNPWKPILKDHIIIPSGVPEFSLSTISAPEPSKGIPFPTPRLRTLVFRGFWLELPENDKNPHWGKLNPQVRARQKDAGGWESEILTFTTDARMHKAISEIFYSPPSENDNSPDILCAEHTQLWGTSTGGGQLTTTGGGAWVEACFWVKEPLVQTQWRIGGRCYLLALEDIKNVNLPYVKEVRRRIEERVRTPKDAEGGICYHEEILAHFSNLSPGLRASFAGGEGENVEDVRRGELARKHFRVGVIIPERVDRVDLRERGGAGRRWVYILEGHGKEDKRWVEREVWP